MTKTRTAEITTTDYTVFGPCAPHGKVYRTLRAASRAIDRMDQRYGAAAHYYHRSETPAE